MKLWLDDQIDDPATPDRHTPEGWVGCKTALQACRILKTGKVTRISFDHDLGPSWAGTGYTVACFIEKYVYFGKVPPLDWSIHSANPVGRDRIKSAMQRVPTITCKDFYDEKDPISGL